jgi:glutathione reductase (NADPH)
MARHMEVHFKSGEIREAGLVLYATGRNPNTAGLGLKAAGVELGPNGEVKVDDWSQTGVPSIFAVGDVTDRLALTPVAIREGTAFAETIFGDNPTKADHSDVATAVFTQPEIGTVGLTEAQARAAGPVLVYRAAFRPMQNILAGRDEKMLMKLLVAKDSRKVLGVHIVGPAAGEMIQLAGIAVKMGATKEDFDRTVAVHPTAAEELVTMRDPAAE